jgi:hypothetical protein
MVRAKMRCNSKWNDDYGHTRVVFNAVYSDDPNSENKSFTDATPAASLDMSIDKDKPAALFFEQGKCYYVDIHEAPDV